MSKDSVRERVGRRGCGATRDIDGEREEERRKTYGAREEMNHNMTAAGFWWPPMTTGRGSHPNWAPTRPIWREVL